MAKKSSNVNREFFSMALSGVLGSFAAVMVVGLFSLFFCGLGYYLVVRYNKKGTKPFQDIQQEQYMGVLLFTIGLLPWIRYFAMGFLFEAGSSFFDANFE